MQEVRYRDKAVALRAVQGWGLNLRFASKELCGDKEVVLEAVRNSGAALMCASDNLRADKELVLEAVRRNGFALQYASNNFRADKDVVLEAVRQNGLVLEYVGSESDLVLLAARHQNTESNAPMDIQHWMREAGIDGATFDIVVDCPIAVEGEDCPITIVSLSSVPAERDNDGNVRDPEHFRCSCNLMSGFSFECDVADYSCKEDLDDISARHGSTLDDLARTIVDKLREHMKTTERVFIVFDVETESVTPWDWNRPLSDFLLRFAQDGAED